MAKPSPTLARWNTLRQNLCWRSSVLAPALAALEIIELPATHPLPTAAIDARGRMFINAAWCGALADEHARFVILHECLHLMLRHHERVGGRDPVRWNIAADLVINDVIPGLGGLDAMRPATGLFRDTHAPFIPPNLSVEEVYELLREHAQQGKGGPQATEGVVGAGCGVGDVDGGTAPPDAGQGGLSPGEWRNIAQAVANAAKQAGTEGGAALAPLLRIPPSRVPWQALLRELAATAISRAGRDVVTWAKRSRRSPRQVILPGTRTNDVRLAIIIDSSGSMSDDELAACVAETRAAVDAAGVRAYLVVHDHEVRTKVWIAPGSGVDTVSAAVIGRGGTRFGGAYEAVGEERTTFAAVVHFTDGYPGDEWPTRPANCARAICALTPDGRGALIPDGWRVVPIERPGRV